MEAVSYPSTPQGVQMTAEVSVPSQPFDLPIEDRDLVMIIDRKIKDSENFYNTELKLKTRRETNQNFWVGKQMDEAALYDWQVPYKDNIIWQDLETRIAIASSKLPDVIATPVDITPDKRDSARTLQRYLDLRIKNEGIKRMMKNGLRDLHLFLQGIVKIRWDKHKGANGDFVFERLKPQRVIVDHTASIPEDGFTADNMEFIAELLEEPIGVVSAKFPNKRNELFQSLGIVQGTTRQMATKIKYHEVWFTFYAKDGTPIEGVCWKYNNLILDKMYNPYYDKEGYNKVGEVDDKGENKSFYHNHFDRPRKPYMFFSHMNLGNSPIDDTSPVEQAIPLQRIVNKRGRQITEIADRTVPKLAFAGAYITKEESRRVTNDPNEHIWFDKIEDISKALQVIPAVPPNATLYTDLAGNRAQIDSKFSTHSTTRGQAVGNESGISKQITREGDLTITDDVSETVIQRVIFEMANWATQMMKVMYDQKHYDSSMGKDGELIYLEIQRDQIHDGCSINVRANSTDAPELKAIAQNNAKLGVTDPLTFNEDMDTPNPKERTKRLVLWSLGKVDPNMLMAYAKEVGIELTPGGGTSAVDDSIRAMSDINRALEGEEVQPTNITEGYVQKLIDFVNSSDFEELDDEQKQAIVALKEAVKTEFQKGQVVDEAQAQAGVAQPTQQPANLPTPTQPAPMA